MSFGNAHKEQSVTLENDYFENHTKHINALCERDAEILNVTLGCIQSNRCAEKNAFL
jgi:hypothetical protein